ncbi:MAG: phasin family protein [Bradyrhizobium sp.]|uniref:phasin family protein n=1 Tax=Bradyrhizobium sp. TaxID=376 RepID=UPI001228CA3C|nr:phasin family protein [Bradyrhizobium sp.]THD60672.1 MAG: phasin family protein [Bradyrhizobium sp.]
MPTTDQDKPSGKPRQRNRKADQPDRKPEPQQSPMLDQRVEDQIAPMAASAPIAPVAASAPINVAAAPAENYPISVKAIANAYGDYTRKSLLENRQFVEKFMAVQSLDKATEVQIEFTRDTYVNFIAEAQKIGELYRELARQVFRLWGFGAETTEPGLASWPTVASQSQH